MDIRTSEMHYRWLDSPSELVVIDEMPDPSPTPHPEPTDPPPTAENDGTESHPWDASSG